MTTTPTPAARVSGTIKALDRIRIEASGREAVPLAGTTMRELEAIALALSGRLGCIERIARAAIQPDPEPKHPDDEAVDRFAAAMKTKLRKKRAEGRSGWDGPECDANVLTRLLREHVEKGDPLDVGNLSMMLHQRGERIQTAPEPQQVVDARTEDLRLLRRAVQMLKDYDEGHSLKAKDVLLLLSDDLANRATPSSAGTVSVEAAYSLEVISTVARVSQTFASGCDRCDADDLEKLEEAGLMDRNICEDEFGQDSLEVGEVMWTFNAAGEAIVRALAGEGGR